MPALLLAATAAHAEQGCPDGLYPGGAAPGQICIPMPGYGIDAAGGQSQAEPRWVSRWGAIAISDNNGSGRMGKSESMPSRGQANKAALADCKASGGSDCEITQSYSDQCVAVAWGDTFVTSYSGVNTEVASDLAVQKCSQSSANCKIYYAGCSYPERLR